MGQDQVSRLKGCPHFRGGFVQNKSGHFKQSLIQRCLHFRGCTCLYNTQCDIKSVCTLGIGKWDMSEKLYSVQLTLQVVVVTGLTGVHSINGRVHPN